MFPRNLQQDPLNGPLNLSIGVATYCKGSVGIGSPSIVDGRFSFHFFGRLDLPNIIHELAPDATLHLSTDPLFGRARPNKELRVVGS